MASLAPLSVVCRPPASRPSQRRTRLAALLGLLLALLALLAGPGRAAPLPTDTAAVRQQLEQVKKLLDYNNDSALVLSRQLLRISRRLRYDYGAAQSQLQLGRALLNEGKFDSSLYYVRRAQQLFTRLQQPMGIAGAHLVSALIYKRMGDARGVEVLTRRGLRQAQLAQAVAQTGPYPVTMVSSLINQGIIYRDLNRPDSARRCYLAAIDIELRYRPAKSGLGVAYADYAQLLIDYDHDYPTAIDYLRRALALYRVSNERNAMEHAYRNLSWAYRLLGRPAQAMATADSSLALGRASGDPHRLFNSLEAGYMAYHAAGRDDVAFRLLDEQRQVNNELQALAQTQAVARIEAAYEVKQQQDRIRRLAEANARKQRQLWGQAVGLGLLAVLLGFGAWQYRAQRRANARLLVTNQTIRDNHQRIQEQSDHLTLLMRELHHRVKNNLAIVSSLLSLQAGSLADAATARAVREAQQRVVAMSLLHQRLYQTPNVTVVELQPYVTELLHSLLASYGYGREFDLALSLDLPLLDVDRAVPLGLIINELVTNALKHAYHDVPRPWLRLGLLAVPGDPGGLLLEVEDNGPGVAPARWAAGTSSFGHQLILALSEQMGGTVTRYNRPGAYFQLLVPGVAVSRQ